MCVQNESIVRASASTSTDHGERRHSPPRWRQHSADPIARPSESVSNQSAIRSRGRQVPSYSQPLAQPLPVIPTAAHSHSQPFTQPLPATPSHSQPPTHSSINWLLQGSIAQWPSVPGVRARGSVQHEAPREFRRGESGAMVTAS